MDFAAGVKMEACLFLANYGNLVFKLLSDWERQLALISFGFSLIIKIVVVTAVTTATRVIWKVFLGLFAVLY